MFPDMTIQMALIKTDGLHKYVIKCLDDAPKNMDKVQVSTKVSKVLNRSQPESLTYWGSKI